MSSWQRWRRLGRDERAETLRAAVLVPSCAIGLRTLGLPRLLRIISARARRPALGQLDPPLHTNASLRAVDRACAYGPDAACLTRSLTLMYLLARRGRVTELKIGAQPVPGGLLAHAWVEANGAVLNDPANLRAAYAVLPKSKTAA